MNTSSDVRLIVVSYGCKLPSINKIYWRYGYLKLLLFVTMNSIFKSQFKLVQILFYQNFRRNTLFFMFRNSYVINRCCLNFEQLITKLRMYFDKFDFSLLGPFLIFNIHVSLNLFYLKHNWRPEYNKMLCNNKIT